MTELNKDFQTKFLFYIVCINILFLYKTRAVLFNCTNTEILLGWGMWVSGEVCRSSPLVGSTPPSSKKVKKPN